MKTEIPTEVEMKLEMARQCELSIERLKGYEYIMDQIKQGHMKIVIPKEVFKRFQDWAESQTIIERTNIECYGKKNI